jgi:signal transduction histidine kinase
VERLEALVDSLLDLSRIEVSRTEPACFSLSEMLTKIAQDYASRAREADLDFSSSIPDVDLKIVGDPAQIRRAVENLLDNACKFTPPGGLITFSLQPVEERARITVGDTGIGIPTADQDHLFRRFHRARNAVDYPGSGLGLAIVKAIVDRHKGWVDVTGDTGGTSVALYVPIESSK